MKTKTRVASLLLTAAMLAGVVVAPSVDARTSDGYSCWQFHNGHEWNNVGLNGHGTGGLFYSYGRTYVWVETMASYGSSESCNRQDGNPTAGATYWLYRRPLNDPNGWVLVHAPSWDYGVNYVGRVSDYTRYGSGVQVYRAWFFHRVIKDGVTHDAYPVYREIQTPS